MAEKKKFKKLPEFKSLQEIADFFKVHDKADYNPFEVHKELILAEKEKFETLPEFKSLLELAEFFKTHDKAEYNPFEVQQAIEKLVQVK